MATERQKEIAQKVVDKIKEMSKEELIRIYLEDKDDSLTTAIKRLWDDGFEERKQNITSKDILFVHLASQGFLLKEDNCIYYGGECVATDVCDVKCQLPPSEGGGLRSEGEDERLDYKYRCATPLDMVLVDFNINPETVE